MKLYLDDVRESPKGWTRARTAKETIDLIQSNYVDALSLDHDLGENQPTGYDVMLWLERFPEYLPDVVVFHTDNPVGRMNMQAALDSILRRLRH